MTKKSAARAHRDEVKRQTQNYKKKNAGWDDLKTQYTSNQNVLNTMANSLMRFFEIPDIFIFLGVEQRPYAAALLRGFSADMKNFQKRLTDIFEQHRAKTGMVDMEDPTNYTNLIRLTAAYIDFGADVQALLQPVYRQLLAVMQTIETNVQQANAMRQQTDAESAPQPA